MLVDIDAGYHINANPASDPNLIPTQLTVGGLADLTVDYPKAQAFKPPFAPQGLAVYTGQVTLRVHLPPAAPAVTQVQLRVAGLQRPKYCLLPAIVDLPVAATR